MPRVVLEVCVETVEDAVAAAAGGADRLELCSALDVGGLTPPLDPFHAVRTAVGLPVVVMVRPRSGDFAYTLADLDEMIRTVVSFRPLAPDGFVFGPLTAEGGIERDLAAMLRAVCGPIPAVFHRAFDELADLPDGLEELIALGFTRVLTSGGPGPVPDHLPQLAALVQQAAGRIQVMPGGGVTAATAAGVVQFTRCEHLHGSFSEPHGHGRRTSRAAVAAARAAVDQAFGVGPMASG